MLNVYYVQMTNNLSAAGLLGTQIYELVGGSKEILLKAQSQKVYPI